MSEPPGSDSRDTKRFFGALLSAIGLMVLCLSGLCTLIAGITSIGDALSGRFIRVATTLVFGGPAICLGLLLGVNGLDLMTADVSVASAAVAARARPIRLGCGFFFVACAMASPLPALVIWREPYLRPGVSGVVLDAVPPLILGFYLLFTSRPRLRRKP